MIKHKLCEYKLSKHPCPRASYCQVEDPDECEVYKQNKMKKLLILIPSYKRVSVIDLTLKSFLDVHQDNWQVTVCVGDNKSTSETEVAISKYKELYKNANIEFNLNCYSTNIGKAECLNNLLKNYDNNKYDIIATMDNDMQFIKPWYFLLDKFLELNRFDFVGFGSSTFWFHIPYNKGECRIEACNDISIYFPIGIAGGLLVFKPDFLRHHKWTNKGGVYGEDDGMMCTKTSNKAVFYWNEDWLRHDPLSHCENPAPELAHYQAKKAEILHKGKIIFPEGWDE